MPLLRVVSTTAAGLGARMGARAPLRRVAAAPALRRPATPVMLSTLEATALGGVRGMTAGKQPAPLDHARLEITKTAVPKEHVPKEKLTFGTTFSDHMLECDWTKAEGWAAPVIRPYGPFEIDPAASSLHYALECFEGMKAYIDADDNIRLFRPMENMRRLNNSMARLFMPAFQEAELLELLKELVRLDRSWIPKGEGFSLYIRPTAISTHRFLGVGPSASVKLYVILAPVGPYYKEGFAAVTLYADASNTRAWPGGTGDTKIGGNYAPTIAPQMDAAAKGYSQVLWLFGPDHEITEVGTMNLFMLWVNEDGKKELITAPLDGTILPGITRDSVLQLARSWGEFEVSERTFTMGEVAKAVDEGRVIEAFGSGTAAVVSPIKLIHFEGRDYNIPIDAEVGCGPLTKRMWDTITGIQYGRIEGPPGWSVVVKEEAKPADD